MKPKSKISLFLLAISPLTLFAQNMQISGGFEHTIVLCASGTVMHTGARNNNQDGTGTWSGNNLTLTSVPGVGGAGVLNTIQMVDAGSTHHTIALNTSGQVIAFGNDYACQLGQGSAVYPANPSYVKGVGGVGNLTGIKYIVGSSESSYAIRASDGALIGWGNNTQGQLGLGTVTATECTPKVVGAPLNSNVVQVDGGDNFTLALLSNGTVYGIGENVNGQLGIGNTTDQSSPQQVMKSAGVPLTNVVNISCGDGSSYAILADGTLWSWGHGGWGQLGLGNCTVVTPYATQVLTGAQGHASGFLQNVKQVAGGNAHAVIVLNDGTVYTMGSDQYGQLGDGTIGGADVCGLGIGCKNVPYKVASLSNIVSVSDGDQWSFAVTNTGTVMAWGQNNKGQLGINSTTNTGTPTAMNMSGCIVLPVELLSFEVISKSAGNILNWMTATEHNTSWFEIERSTDGINFTTIAKINAVGESDANSNYEYYDISAEEKNSIIYYRLKMVDADASYQYSSVKIVSSNSKGLINFSVFPIPTEADKSIQINFQNQEEESVIIKIYDLSGKILMVSEQATEAGFNTYSIPLTNFSKGVYVLRLQSKDEVIESKIVIQ
jgi:alpha-tubulin suppressor-like RCC1 family protein